MRNQSLQKKKRKAPSTPYEIFCDEKREELKHTEQQITEHEINSRLRIWWREISDLEAQRYVRLAEDSKAPGPPSTHSEPYPAYPPYSYNYPPPPPGPRTPPQGGYTAQETYAQGVYPGQGAAGYVGQEQYYPPGTMYPGGHYSGQSGFEKHL